MQTQKILIILFKIPSSQFVIKSNPNASALIADETVIPACEKR